MSITPTNTRELILKAMSHPGWSIAPGMSFIHEHSPSERYRICEGLGGEFVLMAGGDIFSGDPAEVISSLGLHLDITDPSNDGHLLKLSGPVDMRRILTNSVSVFGNDNGGSGGSIADACIDRALQYEQWFGGVA